MSQPTIGDAATTIQFLIVVLGGCFGVINALFFFVLNRIKKNIDSLWAKRNKDSERLTIIETRCIIKNK